jgi:hypothetical protein
LECGPDALLFVGIGRILRPAQFDLDRLAFGHREVCGHNQTHLLAFAFDRCRNFTIGKVHFSGRSL